MPAADPANSRFVYQRFERGVLMYNADDGSTRWLPMGETFRALLTGIDLPPDLAAEAAASPFLRQYDPAQPAGVAPSAELPGTNLDGAFVPDVVAE